MESDYFGLLYTTAADPRVWLDLDKHVGKFFKSDPWVLQFAVKFYPPEPAQLQEDVTRYNLCLQVIIINYLCILIFLISIFNYFRYEMTYWKTDCLVHL